MQGRELLPRLQGGRGRYWSVDTSPQQHWCSLLTGTISTPQLTHPAVIASRASPTSQTGLELLRKDGRVLKCYRDIHDAIWCAALLL